MLMSCCTRLNVAVIKACDAMSFRAVMSASIWRYGHAGTHSSQYSEDIDNPADKHKHMDIYDICITDQNKGPSWRPGIVE